MTTYLDCNATTPIEPRVRDVVVHYLEHDFGNASSRTHSWGTIAKQAVQAAREQIAQVVCSKVDEVIFTSGATESNNMAILGIAHHAEITGRKHIVSTTIEHKAVLEPLSVLEKKGFEITLVPVDTDGRIDPDAVKRALRPDTVLVSIMHINNETGVQQPIKDISNILCGHEAIFHVDAAQGFGKEIEALRSSRIDLISISGHKIYGPKGIGALVSRRRGYKRLPLEPLLFGGGQEGGLRPGTLPVHLIAGLGSASEIALNENSVRKIKCLEFRNKALSALSGLDYIINGNQDYSLPHTLNISFRGLNSEAMIVALKDIVGISNGSACTSSSYEPSHVLKAMNLDDDVIKGSIRLSWCHLTEEPDWESFVAAINRLR